MSNKRSRAETVALLAKRVASDPDLKILVKEYLEGLQSGVDAALAQNSKSVMNVTDEQLVRFAAFSTGQSELLKTLTSEVLHPATDAALSTRTGSDLI